MTYGNVRRAFAFLIALVMLFGCIGFASAENESLEPEQSVEQEETRSATRGNGGAGYYLVSDRYGWNPDSAYKFVENSNNAGEYMLAHISMQNDDEFKVVYSSDGSNRQTWYPDGNNLKINKGSGYYTLYFKPEWQDVWSGYVYQQRVYNINVTTSGQGTVDAPQYAAATSVTNSNVTITVTPADGYKLKKLKVDGNDVLAQLNNGAYTFAMPAHDVAVEVEFLQYGTTPHTITVVANGLGTAFAEKKTARYLEDVSIITEGSIGYVATSVTGLPAGYTESDGVYTFEMPDEDITVTFTFGRQDFTVTLISDTQGTMNAIPRNGKAFAGSTVQVIVNANEGYVVDTFTVTKADNGQVSAELKSRDGQTFIYEFTMPSSNVTVTATYAKKVTAGYYLIGDQGWGGNDAGNFTKINPDARFTQDPNNSDQWILKIDIPAGYGIKAVKVSDTAIEQYYPNPGDNCTVNEAGTYLVYFRPGYGGDESVWYSKCLRLVKLDLARDYYLVNLDGTQDNQIRTDDKLYINKDFNPNTEVTGGTLNSIYGITYEHMVLTYLNGTDKIKVGRVEEENGVKKIKGYYPDDGAGYPDYSNNMPTYSGMVFVFFEEQLGNTALGGKAAGQYRGDWTNKVFDVQKAYRVDMEGKNATNPLNAEALTYNLPHGSVQLSTGTAFISTDTNRKDETNIIYELSLNQDIYCSITPEAGYTLVGTPYITYGDSSNPTTVEMTLAADGRWVFKMPDKKDVVIHAPMYKVFRTQSALLSGSIGINFFVNLDCLNENERKEDCMMKFYINGELIDSDTFDENVHSSVTPSNYGFTCRLNAMQLADTITAELYCGSRLLTTENYTKKYSFEEYVTYFDRADSTQNNNANALRVIRATLDFGYYAQKLQFAVDPNKNDENNALSEKYTAVSKAYSKRFDYAGIQDATDPHGLDAEGNKDIANSAIKSVGLQLAVDSETALMINLHMKDSTVPTITVGGETLSPGESKEQGAFTWSLTNVPKDGDPCYQVKIAGISAHNLDMQFTVTGDAGGSFTINASAFSYVNSLLKNAGRFGESADLAKNAAAAIYKLHEAEVIYRRDELHLAN